MSRSRQSWQTEHRNSIIQFTLSLYTVNILQSKKCLSVSSFKYQIFWVPGRSLNSFYILCFWCFVRVWNLVAHIKVRTWAGGVWEEVFQENIGPKKDEVTREWRKQHNEDSNVRHPRFVLYNSKELGMLTLTVEHNYHCYYYMEFTTTTCFGPICGPSSGCG